MPEGHTIRRKVVDQAPHLVGHRLRASSPSGRFAPGAAAIDGRVLETIDAWGKHLFYFFGGRRVLHVHLGMDGRYRHHRLPPERVPPPRRTVALRVTAPGMTFDLSSPKVCQVIDVVHQRRIVGNLGPDPLRPDADSDAVLPRLAAYDGPIGVALLDQSLIAGIGNVYRAEILFALGIHPERAAATITREEWSSLWDTSVRMLEAGVRDRGEIITVDPRDFKVRDRRSTYVYGQRICAHCGFPVRHWDLQGREAWACENCQPLSR
ncbi:MAG TPA: DNA-formamidopyrimidine glycosylase family protein [Acidimicrobiales bacterium]|nr:DNA-formamidopyrimidine glycosylase family protein [Acidimicrobiales bacterium]